MLENGYILNNVPQKAFSNNTAKELIFPLYESWVNITSQLATPRYFQFRFCDIEISKYIDLKYLYRLEYAYRLQYL